MADSNPASRLVMAAKIKAAQSKPKKGKPTELAILDCGVGRGRVAESLRDAKVNCKLTGIEIFDQYLDDPALLDPKFHDLYSKIVRGDFTRELADLKSNSFDYVVFGDSLEHCENSNWAEHCLAHAIRIARKGVFVNIPIHNYPQGELYGNKYEVHNLQTWTAPLEAFGGEKIGGDDMVACYWFPAIGKRQTYEPKTIQEQAGTPRFNNEGALYG